MKTKVSPSAVGMFVMGAVVLGVVAYLSFGGTNVFSKPARFLMYFDESVSGLDPGAAVKLNGVRIGRVAAINIRYDAGTKQSLVRTVCEVDRNIVTDSAGKLIDMTNAGEFQSLIDHGLRARLNLTGITGLLFVELDFEDPRKYPADPRFMAEQYPTVPTIPSPISEVQQSIVEIVGNLKKVDFAGLAKDIHGVLAATNQKINDLDVKALSERVGRAADAVNAFVSSPEAKQTFANLNGAITEVRAALAKVDQNTGPVTDQLKQTLADAQAALKSLDAAAVTTRSFVRDQGQVGDDVAVALRQVADAAASLERLADAIERNPSSILVGRKKK
ncbi:MAG TPA: MlaD family protein [Lacunisphaera sp.]|nr:MlaD family protein [Lacunisphaera sp.]